MCNKQPRENRFSETQLIQQTFLQHKCPAGASQSQFSYVWELRAPDTLGQMLINRTPPRRVDLPCRVIVACAGKNFTKVCCDNFELRWWTVLTAESKSEGLVVVNA